VLRLPFAQKAAEGSDPANEGTVFRTSWTGSL
jgi:hypothetical protein